MTVVDTINTVEVRDMMEEEEVKALLLREVDRVEECVIKEEEMMDIWRREKEEICLEKMTKDCIGDLEYRKRIVKEGLFEW